MLVRNRQLLLLCSVGLSELVFSWSHTITDLTYTQYNTNTGPAYGVMYIPYRGTLTEPRHDVANKRITANVTAVTVETDLPDPTVSFDQLKDKNK